MTRIVAGDPGAEEVVVYLDGELLEWCIEADDVDAEAELAAGGHMPLANLLLDRFGETVATPLRARLTTLTVPPVPHTPHPDLRAHGRLAPRECAAIHRAVLRRVVRPLADTLLSQPAHLHAEEQRA